MFKCAFATDIYQIRNRLGLGQIDPAVEKSAPAELARLGHPGAGGNRESEHAADDIWAAVTVKFDDVLAREARRTGHHDAHRVVDSRAGPGVANLAQAKPPGARRGRTDRMPQDRG